MGAPIESGIGSLWMAKQSALGTKATTSAASMQKLRLSSGSLVPNKKIGMEDRVDGSRFKNEYHFVDAVAGEVGSFTVQAQTKTAGFIFAVTLGVDVVTGSSDPYTHTMSSAGSGGAPVTFYQESGASAVHNIESYSDAYINKLTLEVGQDQKVMHLTCDVQALTGAEQEASAPSTAEDTEDPLLWTEVTGAVSLDGVALAEVEKETLEIDSGLSPFYGDGVSPAAIIPGKGPIGRTISSILTSDTIDYYNQTMYGTASPSAGDTPTNDVYYLDIETVYTRSASRSITIQTPKVALKPDEMNLSPQIEGGKKELVLGGECLKDGSTAALTVIVKSGVSTAFV